MGELTCDGGPEDPAACEDVITVAAITVLEVGKCPRCDSYPYFCLQDFKRLLQGLLPFASRQYYDHVILDLGTLSPFEKYTVTL